MWPHYFLQLSISKINVTFGLLLHFPYIFCRLCRMSIFIIFLFQTRKMLLSWSFSFFFSFSKSFCPRERKNLREKSTWMVHILYDKWQRFESFLLSAVENCYDLFPSDQTKLWNYAFRWKICNIFFFSIFSFFWGENLTNGKCFCEMNIYSPQHIQQNNCSILFFFVCSSILIEMKFFLIAFMEKNEK